MLKDIKIVRRLPIIDGFVQIPNNLEKNRYIMPIEDAVPTPSDGISVKGFGVSYVNGETRQSDSSTPPVVALGIRPGTQQWVEFEVPYGDVNGKQFNVDSDGNIST